MSVNLSKLLSVVACLVMACMSAGAAMAQMVLPPVGEWAVYTNERFGYRLVYPDRWFESEPETEEGDGRAFVTPDGRARIVVFGAHNTQALSLRDYRATVLEEFGGYDELTYSPLGKTWFVLSGFRGNTIYYQKVMFSCAGRIVNVLSISFPTEEKPRFAPMIEEIEDRFRPGRGEETPARCR